MKREPKTKQEINDAIVEAYYQGIEDLANQVLSYLRNTDLVQSWELRELMWSNLNTFQERPMSKDKLSLGSNPRNEIDFTS